ncbi:cellulase family glycosylhydrolase [Anaerosporobacter sp.]
MRRGLSLLMSAVMVVSLVFPGSVKVKADSSSNGITSDSAIVSNEVYKITAKHSGKALDVEGAYTNDGANVQQWTDNGNKQQQWKVVSVGDGYYKLIAAHSGKALDVAAWGTNDGTNVQQWTDNSQANQQWKIVSTGDGYYKLISRHSGKALDVAGGYTNDGANVQIWTDNGNDQQKWKFTKVTSSADTEAPSTPAGLSVSSTTKNTVTITWNASTDNVGVAGYDIYVGDSVVGTATSTSYTVTGLSAGTTYSLYVQAKDAAGNKSEKKGITVKTSDEQTGREGFYIEGTTLYDAYGNPFVMRGINHAYIWYQGQESIAIPAIAKTGANCIRLVLADGQKWTKTSLAELQSLIKLCEDNKLVVIVEVHDALGSDSIADLEKAAQYWIEMKNALIGHEKTVILNIANEWGGRWDGANWKNGYTTVIPTIRNAGIKNTIMVDCAGWGQYPKSIFEYGKEVAQSDTLKNTMFSIHMYEYAGGSADVVKSNINDALNIGYPVCIGEFGIKHTKGDVDEQTIMSYCTEKSVGYLGWSWKGNDNSLSYLDMASDWAGNTLTEQGQAIINGQYGIKATSKVCSVFEKITKDEIAPTVPSNVSGKAISYNSVELSWSVSTDNVGVTGYNIYQDGVLVDISQSSSYTVKYLKANKEYTFSVSAIDAAGNESAKSSTVTVKTLDSNDKEAPTAPTNLKGTASVTTANLSWSASTDNVGVEGYIVYKDGVKVSISTGTSYTVTGLLQNTEYTFTVTAFDDAGNESVVSNKLVLETGSGSEFPAIEPGLIDDYEDWYVGINGGDKPATSTAKITKLETGGLNMTFDLTVENYPCFQVDPATTIDLSAYTNMNIVVTNPNAKEIQFQTIIKDGDWKWVEPAQYVKIPAKTTMMISVPLASMTSKTANRISFRVQSGGGGFAGSIQIHAVDFDLADGTYATTIAEMNRPKTASYYTWNYTDSAFTKTVKSGLDGETLYADFADVTVTNNAGISTETQPGLGTGQDWSQYSSLSCTLTNKGTKAIHVSLVLRTGGGWTWQETGGQTKTDKTVERIIEPGESVDVIYDFNEPIWKSALTEWVNSGMLQTSTDVKGVQFKIYSDTDQNPFSGRLEITNFSLNF